MVESFLPGTEIAIEGLLSGGQLQVLAVFDKPEPLNGPFFEESYYITPSRLPRALLDRAVERLSQACAAYGLREGPVHGEMRLHEGEAWIVEVAARTIGGDCARLLSFGAGRSLEELVFRQALGWPLDLNPCGAAAAIVCSDDFAKKKGISNPVYIAGQTMRTDYGTSFEDSMIKMVGFDMAKNAAQAVYEESGIGPEDVDVV